MEYGLFLAKIVTFVIAIAVVIAIVASAGMKSQAGEKGEIEIVKLNEKYEELSESVQNAVISEEQLKQNEKDKKKALKQEKKRQKSEVKKKKKADSQSTDSADDGSEKASEERKKRVFVTSFDGDIKASATDELREVITAILSIADEKDEVVVNLESQGGMVHSYGLASSQLARITKQGVSLTVCVDKVAASGGYMMACVANTIVSAPFAIIGSIGVVAQLPNFHRLLKKHDVDYEMLTAGEYKRTLTMFGENTDKGREKFVEDLEDTHELFKDFIGEHRPKVDVEKVATGEIWFGTRALEQNLIDRIETSDEYLFSQKDAADLYQVEMVHKKSLPEKLGIHVETAFERVVTRWVQRFTNRIYT